MAISVLAALVIGLILAKNSTTALLMGIAELEGVNVVLGEMAIWLSKGRVCVGNSKIRAMIERKKKWLEG